MNRTLHVADQPGTGSWRVDPGLAISACALILVGLVMVASASISIADGKFESSLHFFWRQSAALAVGIACGTVVALIDPRYWQRFATVVLFAGIAALSAVLIPGLGLEANGAVRWLDLGVVTFHPGEAMKIVFVVYLAAYLAQQGEKVRLYGRYALVPISVFCFVGVLLLAEPDFGTVVVLGLTLVGMLFIAGVPFRTFMAWSAALAIAMAALAVTEPYRLRRLLTFLAPFEAPYGDGFQLVQALIAIGRGEWFGAGLGGSVQKLFYLPAAHTDFLFAVVGEELGFVGMAAVIAAFTVLIFRAFAIAGRAIECGQPFNAHLAYGLGLSLGIQAWINIGVNIGALPTKGLALPFMSYGGNNLVASCLALGLLVRIDRDARAEGGGAR